MSVVTRAILTAVPIKGPYKKGRKDQMSPAWKALVREAMREREISHAELEDLIGAGSGAVSRLLAPTQNTSVWVEAISAALKLPAPGQESDDERLLLERFRKASAESKRALLQHAAAAAGVADRDEN